MHHKHSKILLLFFYFFIVMSVIATGRVNAASFQLTWVDNSQNEDGFHVERKQGTNGTFSLLATVGRNVTSYSDSNLANSTTYCYRLNAFNSDGNSVYTNEACGTTPAATQTPTFDFSLTNSGNKSVTQGQSVTNTVTATLTAGSSQGVSFSTSGLPSGATDSYTTSISCNPTCSRTLNLTSMRITSWTAAPPMNVTRTLVGWAICPSLATGTVWARKKLASFDQAPESGSETSIVIASGTGAV